MFILQNEYSDSGDTLPALHIAIEYSSSSRDSGLNEFQFEAEESIESGVGKGHTVPDYRVRTGFQDFGDNTGGMGPAAGAGADNAHPIVDAESWLTPERFFHCQKIEAQAYEPSGASGKKAFLIAC